MEALYLLVPLSVVLVFAAIWAFFLMSDSGQFDDMTGPAWRVLHDDDSGICEEEAELPDEAGSPSHRFQSVNS